MLDNRKIFFLILSVTFLAGLFLVGWNFFSKKSINKNQTASLIAKKEKNINLLFVGDMMFDRHIRLAVQKNGDSFLFEKIHPLLQNKDFVIGNLEGPVTNNKSVSLASKIGEKNNFIFTFDPEIVKTLANENIKLVNIGNNHIGNFGKAGMESTRTYLRQSQIDFFGDPENSDNDFVIKNINGLKIAFVSYNQFIKDGKQKTDTDIEKAKNLADITILYTHWGAEYVTKPGKEIQNLAHEFIDNGVDLIIGSHPHVIQTKEEYNGKMIYYSLGNFIFDQYFDLNTQKGLAVQVTISENKQMQFNDYNVKMEKGGQTIYE